MSLSKLRAPIVFMASGSLLVATSYAQEYVVQSGDTLSDIAYRFLSHKVYGPKGALLKLVKLNPHISNTDKIKVGELILLNVEAVEKSEAPIVSEVQKNEERPEEKPKEKPEAKPTDTFQSYSTLSLAPIMAFSKLSVLKNNTYTYLSSNLSYGADLFWNLNFSEKLSLGVEFNYMSYSFQKPSNRVLSDDSISAASFALNSHYRFNSTYSLVGKVGYGERVFFRSESATALALEKVQLMNLEVEPYFRLYESGRLEVFGHTPLGYWGSGDNGTLSIEGGFEYGVGVLLKQRTDWGFLQSDLQYRKSSNSYNSFETSSEYVLLNFSFGLDIGK